MLELQALDDFSEKNAALDMKTLERLQATYVVVTPGQVISSEPGFLRGHGTYVENGELLASVAGVVEKVNQLVSVRPLVSRYIGEVGDIVVGRISEVGSKRWKVDINGQQDAVLMLSSVNLPGGAQRRRTYEDQLQMRSFFEECELISAEVQEVRYDGTMWLHTRSLRYGKLENGQLIVVQPALVKRLKQHMLQLPIGIDVILGCNGYIWISRSIEHDSESLTTNESRADVWTERKATHAQTPTSAIDRKTIAKVYNVISTLNANFKTITPESIMEMYNHQDEAM
ncbi:exosome complex exonuclease RRP4 [Thraustotheca clavata]|uniref:Exosome complex exonuclease RRP4 n=1 Tax=Thraustotheca clavata TaxID=74557 RepID=A0A1V9YVZ5_9STRA|nr:exosome complex exonuclease RRP4 [Thraustotheca clavata]